MVTERHEGFSHLHDMRLYVVFDDDAVIAKEGSIGLIPHQVGNFEDIHRDWRVVLAVDEISLMALNCNVLVEWKQESIDHAANFSRQEHERELLRSVTLFGEILILVLTLILILKN